MQEKTLPNQANSTSNIHSMDFGAIFYDIFGSPYQKSGSFLANDSLNFGYLGKPYNGDTELYDYGFRDYSPATARFTTVDPIRDGRNWYCYVVNDPVNFVDLWGLCGSDGNNWLDNKDGTFTALEGATLWGLYGADWQEKSGYTGDPTNLQIGDIVGKKIPRLNYQYSNTILERKDALLSPEIRIDVDNEIRYSRGANIAIGIAEILGGIFIAGGAVIGAGSIEVISGGTATIPAGWATLGGWSAGSTFVAFGIARLAGADNGSVSNDITSVFLPSVTDIAQAMNNYTKGIQE